MLQFVPFASLVQPAFWHALADLKIDQLRLSDDAVDIAATYSVGRSVTDRETGQTIDLGCTIAVGADSFDARAPHPNGVVARGVLKNYNTIEDFRSANKTELFNAHADKIWNHTLSTRDSSLLNCFLLISFADLKRYRYYYWFAFPAFVAKPPWALPSAWAPAATHCPVRLCYHYY
jgi:ubiquitin-like modifier-activating enzyme ATG7